ncbi:thioredoxin domain-containing protein [Streptomyces sp. NBC_00435]
MSRRCGWGGSGLQHADNPVDWWPWSPEAFAEARERGYPFC